MKFSWLLFVGIGIILLTATCSSPNKKAPVLLRQHYELTGPGRCDTTRNRGLDVSVAYFLLDDDSDAARLINDSLRRLATGTVTVWLDTSRKSTGQQPRVQTDVAQAVAGLEADYKAASDDGLSSCWELTSKADTTFTSPKLLTVRFESFAYTGGAHPNTNVSFHTFDRQTGRYLTLTDLVADTTALLGLVEQSFRDSQHLRPGDNLEEKGYFLEDGRFPLAANVGMGRRGMVFHYNPYEVAAYAVGPIELTVPYARLTNVLRPEWQ